MHFKKITVKNWRGLYDSELSLHLDKRLNVISGPNESGKSTALEAIRLALTTKASSRKQSVRDAQPWNTDLKPGIEIEFRSREKDYRLEKTYLKSSGSASFSEKLENGKWTTISEDDAAHSRFLRALNLTESEEFFRTLWVPQGENLELKVSEGLQTRIERAVGAATSNLGESILEYAVSKVGDPETEGWLTKKRRNPSTDSPWMETSEELESLRDRLADLQKEREQHFDRLEEIGNLREEEEELKERLREKNKELENYRKLKEEWDEFRELEGKAEAAEAWYERLMKRKQDWDDRIEEIEKKNEELTSLEDRLEKLREKEEGLEARVEEKRFNYETAKIAVEQLETKRDYLRQLRAKRLNNKIEKLSGEVETLSPPDASSFEELKELHQEISRKQSQLEASELSINLTPDGNLSGTLSIDGEEQKIKLDPGEAMDESAAKSFELSLNGVGRLRVETGMERAIEVKEELENRQKELQQGLREYAVDDWNELRELYEKGKEKRDEIDKLSEIRDNLELDEVRSIEEASLRKFREEHSESLEDEFFGRAAELSAEEVKGRIKQLGNEIGEKSEILEEKKEHWEGEKEDLKELQRRLERTGNQIESEAKLVKNEKERLVEVKEELQELDERFIGKSAGLMAPGEDFVHRSEKDCDLYQELKKAWGEARDKMDELKHEVERNEPEGEEVTSDKIEKLEAEVDGMDKELRKLEGEINRLQGRIGDTADGLHDSIRSIKEEINEQKRRLESHRKETRSHELLRVVLEEAKADTSRKYLEPIKKKVVPRLKEMTGDRYENVIFGSDLKPRSALRDRRNAESDKAELSFGTREQLSFLTRLAMAEVIAEDGRIPVIFDDSLVNTDSGRMEHMRRYLKEASEACQIILFTCHGEDYTWESGANRIELDELP